MNSILIYAVLNVLQYTARIPSDGWWILLTMLPQFIPTFIIVPRFILSLRELYACDIQGQRENDTDTAFGLTSASSQHAAAASAIMFAEAGQNEGEGQGEEIMMEKVEICSAGGGV